MMRARSPRFGIRRPVHFYRIDELVQAYTEDLSPHGAFVHTDAFLPVNGVVDLCVMLGEARPFVVPSRVAYCLPEVQAAALGRREGVGFQFVPDPPQRLAALERYVRSVGDSSVGLRSGRAARVLVACEPPRLRRRLLHALSRGSFELEAVDSGADLYASARSRFDALVVDESIGATRWLTSLVGDVERGGAPILFISASDDALSRLSAFRAGVADYLPYPFVDEELALRVARLTARRRSAHPQVADLAGDLSRMSISSVLSLLAHERRTGLLSLCGEGTELRVSLQAGSVSAVDGCTDDGAYCELLSALRWQRGSFEFRSMPVSVTGSDWSVTGILLESARLLDECKEPSTSLAPDGPAR